MPFDKSVYRHPDRPGAGAKARVHLTGQNKVHAVMGEFKRGTLRSGSGDKATSRDQAVAIALSEARKSGASIPMPHDNKGKAYGKVAQSIEPGKARGVAVSTVAKAGRLPIINAPLFDDQTKEPGFDGKDQWREPLSGPSDRTVGNPPGEMSNLRGFEQNQSGTPDLTPPFPAPIQESDFPEKGDFSPGTAKNLKDWI